MLDWSSPMQDLHLNGHQSQQFLNTFYPLSTMTLDCLNLTLQVFMA